MTGKVFYKHHADGVTKFEVVRAHRNSGYFECVSQGGTGTHNYKGGLEVFSRREIDRLLLE